MDGLAYCLGKPGLTSWQLLTVASRQQKIFAISLRIHQDILRLLSYANRCGISGEAQFMKGLTIKYYIAGEKSESLLSSQGESQRSDR